MKLKNVLAIGTVMAISYISGEIAGIVRATHGVNEGLKDRKLKVAAMVWEPFRGKCSVNVSEITKENEEDSQ